MKMKTPWKTWKNNPLVGKRLFNDEFGFFKITKVKKCKEYCNNASTPDGSHWFDKDKAFIITDSGLRFAVPYISLILTSVDEKGKRVAR